MPSRVERFAPPFPEDGAAPSGARMSATVRLIVELLCYGSAIPLPQLLTPVIHGAFGAEMWRTATVWAVGLSLVATGLMVRSRWKFSWMPTMGMAGALAALTSLVHPLTVWAGGLSALVMASTLLWPEVDEDSRSPLWMAGAAVGLLAVSSVIGYAAIRMALLAGIPLSLSHAIRQDKAVIYLMDNPQALSTEGAPDGIPWALYAAKHGDAMLLEYILARGAGFNYDWARVGAPLDWYAAHVSLADCDFRAKALLLIRYGAPAGGAALAAKSGDREKARILVELGDSLDQMNADGITVLGGLIEANEVKAVDALLSAGVRIGDAYGPRARMRQIRVPSHEMWGLLWEHGQAAASHVAPFSGAL